MVVLVAFLGWTGLLMLCVAIRWIAVHQPRDPDELRIYLGEW